MNFFSSEPNPPATRPAPRPTALQRLARFAPQAYLDRGTVRIAALVGALALVVTLSGLLLQRIVVPDNSAVAAQPKIAAVHAIAAAPAIAYRTIDDVPGLGALGEQFFYTGSWQHVRGQFDGRSEGTSSRAFQLGAGVAFPFRGERFRLFGVRGPNGGYASLLVDGSPTGTLSFFAKHKEVAALVYASPTLDEGLHEVQIQVIAPPDGSAKRGFVNIDGAAFGSRSGH